MLQQCHGVSNSISLRQTALARKIIGCFTTRSLKSIYAYYYAEYDESFSILTFKFDLLLLVVLVPTAEFRVPTASEWTLTSKAGLSGSVSIFVYFTSKPRVFPNTTTSCGASLDVHHTSVRR